MDSQCVFEDPFKPFRDSNTGKCRGPKSTSECHVYSQLFPYFDQTTGNCRKPMNNSECMEVYTTQSIFDQNVSTKCRNPVSNAECRGVNPYKPIYDRSLIACRAARSRFECQSINERFYLLQSQCRPLESNADCLLLYANGKRPFYDSIQQICREPKSDADCEAIDVKLPHLDEFGNCGKVLKNNKNVVIAIVCAILGAIFVIMAIFGILFLKSRVQKRKFIAKHKIVLETVNRREDSSIVGEDEKHDATSAIVQVMEQVSTSNSSALVVSHQKFKQQQEDVTGF